MKKFASLATGAVVASMIVPVFAVTQDGSSNTTTVDVNEQAIALVAGNFDFDAGAPYAAMDADQTFNVISNAALGYTVKLDLSDLEKAGVRADGDLIAASSIDAVASVVAAAEEAGATDANEAYGNNVTGMDDNEILAGSDIRSLEDGDDFSVTLSFDMPFIETGEYNGSATWTADSL